jgi:hypothetical protein
VSFVKQAWKLVFIWHALLPIKTRNEGQQSDILHGLETWYVVPPSGSHTNYKQQHKTLKHRRFGARIREKRASLVGKGLWRVGNGQKQSFTPQVILLIPFASLFADRLQSAGELWRHQMSRSWVTLSGPRKPSLFVLRCTSSETKYNKTQSGGPGVDSSAQQTEGEVLDCSFSQRAFRLSGPVVIIMKVI